MKIDVSKYLYCLDGLDLNEEQKLELLNQLAVIMGRFVDCALGFSPEQQVPGGKLKRERPQAGPIRLGSTHTLTPLFNDAAHDDAARRQDQ